ncbi:MAG TPA: GTPase HflX [Frankiaceae bacterium]|nr:GTPase HflX [Frankiaceae bacterium]
MPQDALEPIADAIDAEAAVRSAPATTTTTKPATATARARTVRPLHELQGEGFDLADRAALRRVAGLTTELEDVTEVEYRKLRLERVVLIGVWTEGTGAEADNSLAELAALAETAGSEVLDALVQRRDKPSAATFVGSGKARELRDIVVATGADTVICDGELTPGQLKQLEEIVKVKVIDRTALILDIFAQHASSREGKAQVELAQLNYLLPRLRGWGESMSRQGGGIGTRMGGGETKIETDRRRIRARVAKLRRDISGMAVVRETKRSDRVRHEIPSVAIAGYTNAGKSSLLNRLTGAGVLVENALFATLDPTVRRAELPDGRSVTLTDTVGFVRHLPHQLIDAFRSTLEEVSNADLVVHVVDGSHADPEAQIAAVREVFGEIGANDVPELLVVNKIDAADPLVLNRLRRTAPSAVFVSAVTGDGLAELLDVLVARVPRPDVEVEVLVPYDRGDLVARVHDIGEVLGLDHRAEGTYLHARVGPALAHELNRLQEPVAP